jgi:hypothetical protein
MLSRKTPEGARVLTDTREGARPLEEEFDDDAEEL